MATLFIRVEEETQNPKRTWHDHNGTMLTSPTGDFTSFCWQLWIVTHDYLVDVDQYTDLDLGKANSVLLLSLWWEMQKKHNKVTSRTAPSKIDLQLPTLHRLDGCCVYLQDSGSKMDGAGH